MIVPVILSGGAGTRLWPLSRESHPKPFIKLPDGLSLLQKTFLRACQLDAVEEVLTITNRDYFLKSKPEYQQVLLKTQKQTKQSFLLEPTGRNTACAIVLAAMKVMASHGEQAILLVLPADHIIDEEEAFGRACRHAADLAKHNYLVTFGVQPTTAETGFGYIECGAKAANLNGFHVKQFIEKPNAKLAHDLFHSKKYLWNAGIFCFKVDTILQEYALHAPDIFAQARDCWQRTIANSSEKFVYHLDPETFKAITNISIDYALLEKSTRTTVVPCEFSWRDIGSWSAYKDLHAADEHNNTVLGDAILIDARDNFVHSDNRMVAAIGVDNLIVVDTPDALLVAHKERAQDVKHVVDQLKASQHHSYHSHRTVQRPWGFYTILTEFPTYKVKRVLVHPGAAISLQSHAKRNEHWVIVEGSALIKNGMEEFVAVRNDSIFILQNNQHRIQNIGECDLIFIEVQTGDYLGEDDITRYDDLYGRV